MAMPMADDAPPPSAAPNTTTTTPVRLERRSVLTRRLAAVLRPGLAVAGGAATAMAVLTGWWMLAPLGAGAVAGALHALTPARRFAVGFLAGGTHLAASSLWVGAISLPGAVALVALQAAGWGVAGLAVTRRTRWPWLLAVALGLSEWARGWWPLGGYPLSQLWLSQADGPFAALAPLLGPIGITTLVVLTGAAIAAVLTPSGPRGAPVTVLLVVVAFLALAGSAQPSAPLDRLEVAAVQGGGPRGIPAVRSDPAPLFERQIALTETLSPEVDLVVWPEGALGVNGQLTAADLQPLVELAAGFDGILVVGVTERFDVVEGAGSFTNAAVAIDAEGLVDRYDKRIPVPFGERVPARRLVERVADLSLVPRDMLPGERPPVVRTDLATIGVAISYENLFARVAREAVGQGAQLLVVPTNASSYVTDEIPVQQLAAARLRAREAGRDLVVVGPTGPTALIRADGTVVGEAPLDRSELLRGQLATRTGLTFYARVGDVLTVAVGGALLAIPLVANGRAYLRRSRGGGRSPSSRPDDRRSQSRSWTAPPKRCPPTPTSSTPP
ncbi:apolipoprotein N-acyltransferase [Nitriliruptoraceae bacterium ZYF776]|nr:apolipoprotein N-acyltransferase [Profundirhabdus halotolerans]